MTGLPNPYCQKESDSLTCVCVCVCLFLGGHQNFGGCYAKLKGKPPSWGGVPKERDAVGMSSFAHVPEGRPFVRASPRLPMRSDSKFRLWEGSQERVGAQMQCLLDFASMLSLHSSGGLSRFLNESHVPYQIRSATPLMNRRWSRRPGGISMSPRREEKLHQQHEHGFGDSCWKQDVFSTQAEKEGTPPKKKHLEGPLLASFFACLVKKHVPNYGRRVFFLEEWQSGRGPFEDLDRPVSFRVFRVCRRFW